MAKVTCVKTDREGYWAVGDIVEIQDDDVELSGPGYEGYSVYNIKGFDKFELAAIFNAKMPEIKEEKGATYWKHTDNKWYELAKMPKYKMTLCGLTKDDFTNLVSAITPASAKETILDKAQEKIHLDSNNMVEASELNK